MASRVARSESMVRLRSKRGLAKISSIQRLYQILQPEQRLETPWLYFKKTEIFVTSHR
jgi:Spy/CpxP family protein refolding chaperone